jgi:hypothetical protein
LIVMTSPFPGFFCDGVPFPATWPRGMGRFDENIQIR